LEIVTLESDYRSIGVPEIIFIDPVRRQARVSRFGPDGYETEDVEGTDFLTFEQIPGLWFNLEWLFDKPRPTIREALELIDKGPSGP
jgi:Uma2 family endonuclease